MEDGVENSKLLIMTRSFWEFTQSHKRHSHYPVNYNGALFRNWGQRAIIRIKDAPSTNFITQEIPKFYDLGATNGDNITLKFKFL